MRPKQFVRSWRHGLVIRVRIVAWLAWTAAGILIGFGVASLALNIVAIVLPNCDVGCDDTLSELVAAITAYGVWLATAVATSVLAWRHLAGQPGRA